MDGNCGNVMALGKFFIPSPIGFNPLTGPYFKSFFMSVTGLNSFESSYCMFKSPTPSIRKLFWMFCLVLRNSLTIKSLFFGSVIFRNDLFLLAIYLFFSNMGLNTVLNIVLNTVLNTILKHGFENVLKSEHQSYFDEAIHLLQFLYYQFFQGSY